MRLLFGMILGAALTVGAAYVHDTRYTGAGDRTLVNWDVAFAVAGDLAHRAREQIEKLAGG